MSNFLTVANVRLTGRAWPYDLCSGHVENRLEMLAKYGKRVVDIKLDQIDLRLSRLGLHLASTVKSSSTDGVMGVAPLFAPQTMGDTEHIISLPRFKGQARK
jgi:hypothetical protein